MRWLIFFVNQIRPGTKFQLSYSILERVADADGGTGGN